MRLNRVIAGLVAAVAVAAMAGCSPNGSVAATYDGQVLTEQRLTELTSVLDETKADSQIADTRSFVLVNEIGGTVITAAFKSLGVTVTDDDRTQWWNGNMSPGTAVYAMWSDPRIHSVMAGYIDRQLVSTLAQSGAFDSNTFMAGLATVTVKLNPRYGTWEPDYLAPSTAVTAGSAGGPLAMPMTFTVPQ
ncbi:MAG: hypothetical protein LBI33_11095 [Propionibacteriaceae bacterium]|jgi:hypothetical protein|nr:hypothetical protein [Propionibacteriaceae bacterium]